MGATASAALLFAPRAGRVLQLRLGRVLPRLGGARDTAVRRDAVVRLGLADRPLAAFGPRALVPLVGLGGLAGWACLSSLVARPGRATIASIATCSTCSPSRCSPRSARTRGALAWALRASPSRWPASRPWRCSRASRRTCSHTRSIPRPTGARLSADLLERARRVLRDRGRAVPAPRRRRRAARGPRAGRRRCR